MGIIFRLIRLAQAAAVRLAFRPRSLPLYRLEASARSLKTVLDDEETLETRVALMLVHPHFRAFQKRGEILALLRSLEGRPPRRLLEIGGALGGTLVLLCRAAAEDARILSIDSGYTEAQAVVLPSLAGAERSLTCLRADSRAPETLERVRDWLDGEKLDLLFIDGDHSLKGVSADFAKYSKLVRPGGAVVFHDIVPDHLTRYGRFSMSDSGEVAVFWAQLKPLMPVSREFVEDPEQDGFGIGLVEIPEA